jgi:hypothetical protein
MEPGPDLQDAAPDVLGRQRGVDERARHLVSQELRANGGARRVELQFRVEKVFRQRPELVGGDRHARILGKRKTALNRVTQGAPVRHARLALRS